MIRDARPVVVFTRTTDYRHESIPAGVAALREIAAAAGYPVEATADPAVFTTTDRYAAVVFCNTSGDVLDDAQRAGLRRHVQAGGGFLGVHCASATEYHWPFYGELVGARFADHPDIQPADVSVADPTHPATVGLPARWRHTDEWYNFQAPPPPDARILLTVDEASYSGGTMGPGHPIAWCRQVGPARSCYTALGHSVEAYADPVLRTHLTGALRWVLS